MNKNHAKARKVVISHTLHGERKETCKRLKKISSIGTERSYRQCLKNYFDFCDKNEIHPDQRGDIKIILRYMFERREHIQQKTLNQIRQALQIVYQQHIPYIQSTKPTVLSKRSYTLEEVHLIISKQNSSNGFTTKLAWHTGIRAHEAATILPIQERAASTHRDWDHRLFIGMPEHKLYTVIGKGGLIRAVAVPLFLIDDLEARRIKPKNIIDREINHVTYYDIGFGQNWSQSFSEASKKSLGLSRGAHGLRHSHSKDRINKLLIEFKCNKDEFGCNSQVKDSLKVLSQELGHFRTDILFCYLR